MEFTPYVLRPLPDELTLLSVRSALEVATNGLVLRHISRGFRAMIAISDAQYTNKQAICSLTQPFLASQTEQNAVRVLKWAVRHGAKPKDASLILAATVPGNLQLMTWLHKRGAAMPPVVDISRSLALNGHLHQCIEFVKQHMSSIVPREDQNFDRRLAMALCEIAAPFSAEEAWNFVISDLILSPPSIVADVLTFRICLLNFALELWHIDPYKASLVHQLISKYLIEPGDALLFAANFLARWLESGYLRKWDLIKQVFIKLIAFDNPPRAILSIARWTVQSKAKLQRIAQGMDFDADADEMDISTHDDAEIAAINEEVTGLAIRLCVASLAHRFEDSARRRTEMAAFYREAITALLQTPVEGTIVIRQAMNDGRLSRLWRCLVMATPRSLAANGAALRQSIEAHVLGHQDNYSVAFIEDILFATRTWATLAEKLSQRKQMTAQHWTDSLKHLVSFIIERGVAGGTIELRALVKLFVLLGSKANAKAAKAPTALPAQDSATLKAKFPILAAALETETFEAMLAKPPNVQIVAIKLKQLEQTWMNANLKAEWQQYVEKLAASNRIAKSLQHALTASKPTPAAPEWRTSKQQPVELSSLFAIQCSISESTVLALSKPNRKATTHSQRPADKSKASSAALEAPGVAADV